MKHLLGALALCLAAATLDAQALSQLDGWIGASGQFDQIASTKETFALEASNSLLELRGQLSINSDKKFGADIANFKNSKSLFDTYFLMEEGYSRFHTGDFTFQLGRSFQKDAVDTPYSLFLSSHHPSAMGMSVHYEDEIFAFESRWIELNNRSDFGTSAHTPQAWEAADGGQGTGFPDRGANLKTIVLKFGSQRFGIQDSAIYTGRSFDLEYFVNPTPEYFTQYFKTTSGRPWTTSGNENNLIGFFWDWTEPEARAVAQILVDDFSLHFLLPSQVPDNPWKAAWTLGGERETPWGRVGLFHAGALKYTFEPITTRSGSESVSAYGYTLYPSNEYWSGTEFRSLALEDNALGYLHGENNLALMATFNRTLVRNLDLRSQVEFLLAGEASPTNAWHDALTSNDVGTHWLDGDLAKTVTWSTQVTWQLGDWSLWAQTDLGWKDHYLKLSASTAESNTSASSLDRYERLWRPSDSSSPVLNLAVGGTWHWDFNRTFWPQNGAAP